MVTIILHSPEHPGNVGAVARVMKNFGITNLVLINPQADHLCEEARNRAKHAQEILENAKIADDSILDSFDLIVATSGKNGSEDNIPRVPLTPQQLSASIGKSSCGLLFGRESQGLTNEELGRADLLVTIPTNEEYPVLNLSHAVTILLYELTKEQNITTHPLMNARQKKELYTLINDVLEQLSFATPEKRETQRRVWKRVLASSFLTEREAQALLGCWKKIKEKM